MTQGSTANHQRNTVRKTAQTALTARRLTLLASVGALGAVMLFAGPGNFSPPLLGFGTPSAQAADATLQHPTGFSDIVAKVKPAVISVRVKIPGSAEPAMMQEFGQDDGDSQQQVPVRPGSPLDR